VSDFVEHRTQDGERWDTLAWRYYADATRYEPIIAANPCIPIAPVLPSGVLVYIPVLAPSDAAKSAEVPPWLR
jgi:phage tail protein X